MSEHDAGAPRYRIGVDVGGTFTDFVIFDLEGGTTWTGKVPTTTVDPSEGIAAGLRGLGPAIEEIDSIAHGTTTATNALIERDGARTAFLTTDGFRDVLEIRRGDRQDFYDGQWTPPPPLVRRRDRIEISERTLSDGQIFTELDEAQVADTIETLKAREVEAVAIAFVHSYQHPGHEARVKELVEEAMPEAFVTMSSEISQEFREFERSSTVAANAFVGPKVERYMHNLVNQLKAAGFAGSLAIMQSNGGVCEVDVAAELPVRLARSGPAGGAMGLERIAELTGLENLVGIDIGGTSADVCLIADGRARWTSPLHVEWGMPLLIPSVDVVSIGAGGGSIAWIDDAGVLHMGPASAGAVPGPAAYERGGCDATSTDAHVVLGRVGAGEFMAGKMEISTDLARRAVEENVASPLEMTVEAAAEGMLQILNNNMLGAVRLVTVEKGYDPRDFVLVGFGGGGPLHVAELARELGMRKAIVPMNPGVLSAWGMLTVDLKQDASRTILERRDALEEGELSAVLRELRDSVARSFASRGSRATDVEYEYFLDLQYWGQVYSLAVPLRVGDDGVTVSDEDLDAAISTFHVEHRREYGHADPEHEVQLVHARVFGRVSVERPTLREMEDGGADPSPARTGSRTVHFDGQAHDAAVYNRAALLAGNRIEGPAMIDEVSSTSAIPPGVTATVDPYGNLILEIEQRGGAGR